MIFKMALVSRQLSLVPEIPTRSDVVYTPREVTKQIIKFLKPSGLCLDPCKGDGAFYDYLPCPKDWCELQEGRNFFDYRNHVDWIITNPPYSNYKEFSNHAFSIANNVSFLIPLNKVFSDGAMQVLHRHNMGIVSCLVYGSGSKIGFDWGFPVANYHFQKGYTGDTKMIVGINKINELIDRIKHD
jgi:hypothetical protein